LLHVAAERDHVEPVSLRNSECQREHDRVSCRHPLMCQFGTSLTTTCAVDREVRIRQDAVSELLEEVRLDEEWLGPDPLRECSDGPHLLLLRPGTVLKVQQVHLIATGVVGPGDRSAVESA